MDIGAVDSSYCAIHQKTKIHNDDDEAEGVQEAAADKVASKKARKKPAIYNSLSARACVCF
jgi:hypothetical protein